MVSYKKGLLQWRQAGIIWWDILAIRSIRRGPPAWVGLCPCTMPAQRLEDFVGDDRCVASGIRGHSPLE
jgi:hypothetical protein